MVDKGVKDEMKWSTCYRRIKKVLDEMSKTHARDMSEMYRLGYDQGFKDGLKGSYRYREEKK